MNKETVTCWLLLAIAPVFAAAQIRGSNTRIPAGEAHSKCAVCHEDHKGASGGTPLLKEAGDHLCLSCHQEGGAKIPVSRRLVLRAPARTFTSQHLWKHAGRWRMLGPWKRRSAVRNGSCVECHDPHERDWKGGGPFKTLVDKTYSSGGRLLPGRPASVAEVCFKCHGSPLGRHFGMRTGRVGVLFGQRAVSSHRIGSHGRPDLPSLRGMPRIKALDCTSCHDGSPDSGLKGPHASRYPYLLSARYETGDGVPESIESYALCYGCHSRRSILNDESFPLHRAHITGQFQLLPTGTKRRRRVPRPGYLPIPGFSPTPGFPPPGFPREFSGRRGRKRRRGNGPAFGLISSTPASCAACHDPHGSLKHIALIHFDKRVVFPNSRGMLDFLSKGRGSGSCDLECHGYNHVNASY